MSVEQILFDVSEALRVPVLVLALLALVVVVVELGALLAELRRRRGRSVWQLENAVAECQGRLTAGQQAEALVALMPLARNRTMEEALAGVLEQVGRPDAEARIAKRLAEYDYLSLRRLERTRILVRMGPALGLMGTLIPLSPALAGLADGDVATLTENLRVAFGVTVAGLLVGAIAFSVSLIRDRLYAQDYSDVEYVAACLTAGSGNGLPVGHHSHWAVAP
ncbi:MAG TPA: MotA/TolQ/ExbB proton channel family protein [Solirubrobacterales bacterium]|nr:MotA/TolQ/ExbB proton channel family protein [Solirubrobacterales bacterium]